MPPMDVLRRKSLDIEVKAADEGAGTVTLYAATFGNVDRQADVIEAGAFTNLDEFVKDGWLGTAHDMRSLPIATVKSAIQDAHGLLLTCEWHTTADAQECRKVVKERLERGKAVKCSIGYRILDAVSEMRDGKGVLSLRKLELFEVSIVNLPANPRAEVVGAKAWWEVFEDARLSLKEGRVLSNKNRSRLGTMAEKLREAASDLDALLAETAGGDGESGEPGAVPGGKTASADASRRLVGDFLNHCVSYPTYSLEN